MCVRMMATARPSVDQDLITVASVPGGHVYVRHLSAPDCVDSVHRLPDPRPCPAPSDQAVWWPPTMLDPQWVESNHDRFDVFHVHFGFDAQAVDNLRELVRVLRARHKPLVYTVHDLRNPHHIDPAAHDAHLDVLISAADRLITLTPGAAAVIANRWGRTAQVVAHPHVVDLPSLTIPRRQRDEFVVAVHLKSIRANMGCSAVIETLCRTVAALPDAVLRVDVHTEVFDPASRNHHPDLVTRLRAAHRGGRLRLEVHECFSDDELWVYLRDEIDVSVLPYRFGTHSGWLEACHDLGTMVVASSCGFYAQQQPCFEYGHDETGLDADSLAAAVIRAYEERPDRRATVAQRYTERQRIAATHRELYRQVLV